LLGVRGTKNNGGVVLTIGMPVFNGQDYVSQAIESLLSQSYPDFRLVISDNASSDATPDICAEYAKVDSRIVFFRQGINRGAVENFKFVLDQSNTELFMWAACDDLWMPHYLENAVGLMSSDDVGFVFPAFALRSIRLRLERRMDPACFSFVNSGNRKERVLKFLSLHFLSHSANIVYSLFRTDLLRAVWNIQDVSSDGLMGAVLLGLSKGVVSEELFVKRYKNLWPGMLPKLVYAAWQFQNTARRDRLALAINTARNKAKIIFPEYARELDFIYGSYLSGNCGVDYSVCNIEHFFVENDNG